MNSRRPPIDLLTDSSAQDYSFGQVLVTPTERKRLSAPESMRFFYVHSFLWSGVRGIKYLKGELSYARLLAPDHPHFAVVNFLCV